MSGKPAARVSDPTACPLPGHGTNPIAAGSGDVFFDGLAAARQGDASACGGAMSGGLATTVLINGKPAATVDSVGTHGNKVTAGSGTVIIGNSHSPAPFVPPEPVVIPGIFNRVFSLHAADGQPIANLNYSMVSESGLEKAGCSSAAGGTGCFSTGKQGEMVTIYVSRRSNRVETSIVIDGIAHVFETSDGKTELKIKAETTPSENKEPKKLPLPNVWLITRGNGVPLFAAKPNASDVQFRIMTAEKLYAEAIQWFEPLADNYREKLWVNPESKTVGTDAYNAY